MASKKSSKENTNGFVERFFFLRIHVWRKKRYESIWNWHYFVCEHSCSLPCEVPCVFHWNEWTAKWSVQCECSCCWGQELFNFGPRLRKLPQSCGGAQGLLTITDLKPCFFLWRQDKRRLEILFKKVEIHRYCYNIYIIITHHIVSLYIHVLSCRSCNSLHLTEIATRRVKHDFSDISQDPNTDFAWEQRREHGRRLVGRFWTLRQRGKASQCQRVNGKPASEFLSFDFCFWNEHPNPFKFIAW